MNVQSPQMQAIATDVWPFKPIGQVAAGVVGDIASRCRLIEAAKRLLEDEGVLPQGCSIKVSVERLGDRLLLDMLWLEIEWKRLKDGYSPIEVDSEAQALRRVLREERIGGYRFSSDSIIELSGRDPVFYVAKVCVTAFCPGGVAD
jgi:hypothetical protein